MAQTTYPILKTHFNISGGSEAISNETIPIPSGTPYQIALAQIPQGKTGVTAIADNEYDGVSIGSVLTVEVNDGTDASPSWTSRTPTDSSSPTSAQVYVHLADEVWSSQLAFNVADAGKNCRVTYTGWGSPLLIEHLNRLIDHVGRLEAWLPLSMHSEGSYNRAWFSPESSELGVNSKRVYVCQSGFAIQINDSQLEWAGGWADFDAAGNCEVAAFSNADYYKKCYIYLYDNSGTLTLASVEGTEGVSAGAAGAPVVPSTDHFKLGIVTVQNDGTVVGTGKILTIDQSEIDSEIVMAYSTGEQSRSKYSFAFKTFGTLDIGGVLDNNLFPGESLEIIRMDMLAEDTGTAATVIQLDVQVDEGSGYNSLFSADGDKPQITGNTGTDQMDTTPTTDMDFSNLTSGVNETEADAVFKVLVDTGPTDAENVSLIIWCYQKS